MSARAALRRDAGGATAEFALVLPAVLLVLALALGGVRAQAVRLLAQDAAADAARSVARGDPTAEASARATRTVPSATTRFERRGDLVCAVVGAPVAVASLAVLRVSAESCAMAGGR